LFKGVYIGVGGWGGTFSFCVVDKIGLVSLFEISPIHLGTEDPELSWVSSVRIEPKDGGKPVEFGPGDLVTFPEGLDCVWKISKPVRKHYKFG